MPSLNKPNPKNSLACNVLLEIPFSPEPFILQILDHLHGTGSELEFTFFDNTSIHDMNRTHLNHDWPTDIITFDLSEGDAMAQTGDALAPPDGGFAEDIFLLGDLYISVEQAAIQANTLGHSLEKELKILIIHGILHLLGYDDQTPEDQTEMDEMQHQIYDLLHTPV